MSTHPFGVEASPGRLHVTGEVDLAAAAKLLDAILAAGPTDQAPDLGAGQLLGRRATATAAA